MDLTLVHAGGERRQLGAQGGRDGAQVSDRVQPQLEVVVPAGMFV